MVAPSNIIRWLTDNSVCGACLSSKIVWKTGPVLRERRKLAFSPMVSLTEASQERFDNYRVSVALMKEY